MVESRMFRNRYSGSIYCTMYPGSHLVFSRRPLPVSISDVWKRRAPSAARVTQLQNLEKCIKFHKWTTHKN